MHDDKYINLKNKLKDIFNIKLVESPEEYKGEHEAPDKDNGSPFSNVIGTYPADFYSGVGLRYYASGDNESEEYFKVKDAYKRPNLPIWIYRAIPKDLKVEINKGDWVTTSKKYAVEHGKDNLNNKYKILKKKVYARDLFTVGDSILEWGYDPQPIDNEEVKKTNVRRKIKDLTRMINGEIIIMTNKNPGDLYYGKSKDELELILKDFLEANKDLDYKIF